MAPSTVAASSNSAGTDFKLAKNVRVTSGRVFHVIIVIIEGQTKLVLDRKAIGSVMIPYFTRVWLTNPT